MEEHNRLNFAGNIKHIYISLGYKQPRLSTKKSTEKAQLNAMPKPFYLRFIKFPMETAINAAPYNLIFRNQRRVAARKRSL